VAGFCKYSNRPSATVNDREFFASHEGDSSMELSQ
jgi:hypothetical protein